MVSTEHDWPIGKVISLAERSVDVHNGPVLNDPGQIEARLEYMEAVEKAFFSIGASIARTECTCDDCILTIRPPCRRCELVKQFSDHRNNLRQLKEKINGKSSQTK